MITKTTARSSPLVLGTSPKNNVKLIFRWTICWIIQLLCILATSVQEVVLQGHSVFRQSIIRGVIRPLSALDPKLTNRSLSSKSLSHPNGGFDPINSRRSFILRGIPSICTDCGLLTWVMWLILNLVVHLLCGLLTQRMCPTPCIIWFNGRGAALMPYLDTVPMKCISWSCGRWEVVLRCDIIPIDYLWYRALFSGHNGFDASVTPFCYAISGRCIGALKSQVYSPVK